MTRWHYQWIVTNEVLPAYVGQQQAEAALNRSNVFGTGRALMPVEFQGAVYTWEQPSGQAVADELSLERVSPG